MKEKIGLVLEGGGLRGAYTAGVLHWLLEQDLHFDYVVGISSGALYASMFVLNKPQTLQEAATNLAADSRNIGYKPIFREGTFVGYNFLLNELLTHYDYPLTEIDKIKGTLNIGVYDLENEATVWKDQFDIANNPEYIQAACTLPVAGKAIKIEGHRYMDGGVTTMIPLQKSIDFGCAKHLVITTKSKDYVRHDQGFFLKYLLRTVYFQRKTLIRDFENRTNVYYQERHLIDEYVKKNEALYMYPSQELGVKRFSGEAQQFKALFALAHEDCDARKAEIMAFYHSVKG